MVAVAYSRWSYTRCSNCKALTENVFLFWIGGPLWEVVAQKGSTVEHLTISMERRAPRPYGLLLRLRLLTSFESVHFCQNVYLISSTTEVRWLDSADNALLDLHNSSGHTWPFKNFYVSLGGKPQKVLVGSFYLKGDILRFLPKRVKASYVHV